MAEFCKVIRNFDRVCNANGCYCCPMKTGSLEGCKYLILNLPAEFERRVMEWAEAHPEPKYPTWVEWFNSMGGVDCGEPIPADIAERLGIKPKEG